MTIVTTGPLAQVAGEGGILAGVHDLARAA